jgi:transcriptional regulator with XRE-family HTH domain
MTIRTKSFISDVSKRLRLVRKEHDYTRREMAWKLGMSQGNYYKNESAISLPRVDTLYRLHTDFDISLDWLLFGGQPMHNKEKQPVIAAPVKTTGLENKLPDARELLDTMEQDHVLRHEVLLYFYKYKQNRETKTPALEPQEPQLPSMAENA